MHPPLTRIQKTAAILGCAASLIIVMVSMQFLLMVFTVTHTKTWSGTNRDAYILYFIIAGSIMLFLNAAYAHLAILTSRRRAIVITSIISLVLCGIVIYDVAGPPFSGYSTLLFSYIAFVESRESDLWLIPLMLPWVILLISVFILKSRRRPTTT